MKACTRVMLIPNMAAPGRTDPGSRDARGRARHTKNQPTPTPRALAASDVEPTATPNDARTRLSSDAASTRSATSAVTRAAVRMVALAPRASRPHARALVAASTPVRLRPAEADRNSPVSRSVMWRLGDPEAAVSTWFATWPVIPALVITPPMPLPRVIRLTRPTVATLNEAVNRNNRMAMALPSTDPNESRSRS